LLRCFRDCKSNSFKIAQNILIREAQYAIAARLEPAVTPLVVANALFEGVAFAIDLNDYLARVRDEIGDVVADGSLAAKVEAGKTVGFEVPP
jgi:hypothetical protein